MGSKVTVAVFALAAVIGCGKAEGGAEPIALSALPTRLANLLCDSLAGCCESSDSPLNVGECKTYYTVELAEDFAEVDLDQMRYDPEAAGACLFALSANIRCGQVDRDQPPACEKVFTGRIALGQPCADRQSCAEVAQRHVYCESPDSSSPAVCVARASGTIVHGKAGDACDYTCYEDQDCDDDALPAQPVGGAPDAQPPPVVCHRKDGLFCNAGTCAPLVTEGAACDELGACRGNAFCHSATGLCTPPQPDDSPCETAAQCQSNRCGTVPGADGEPGPSSAKVCISMAATTAEWCERDFSIAPTDGPSPDSSPTEGGNP